MLDVLGLDPFDPQWARGSGVDDRLRDVVDQLVGVALEQRQAARARRDYAAADAIRAQLGEAGIAVEDTPQGRAGRSRILRTGPDGGQQPAPRRAAHAGIEEGPDQR